MKKIYLRNVLVGLSFVTVLSSAIMSASGPGGGLTIAPGDPSNCTSCHTSSLITSGNSNLNNIRLNGGFTGNGYIPDSVYTMELTFKQTGKSKFGFEITVLDNTNSPCGTLTSINSRTSKTTAVINSKTREYIQHTSAGTSNVATDSTRWVFEWKAPKTNVGKVSFYAVVMATNNNSTNDNGDIVYGKKFDVGLSSLLSSSDASSQDSVTCGGYVVNLKGSGTSNPTAYSWSLPGGTPSSSTLQNPTVVYPATSTPQTRLAILSARNAKGATARPDTLKIIVNATPSPATIQNGASAKICKGDSVTGSATPVTNTSYLWLPVNKAGRTLVIKDSGTYRVRLTHNTSGCTATTANFRVDLNDEPTISISKGSTKDTFCDTYNETLTATGNFIDSVLWYEDGILTKRIKGNTAVFTGNSNMIITAVAKGTSGCKSVLSNPVNIVVRPKLVLTSIVSSKTTSTIDLAWKKPAGISAVSYSLNNVNFNPTTTDTTLKLTGLSPNTSYDITLRSAQPSPCNSADVTITVKTNACSNLSYSVDMPSRVCKGSPLKATIRNLKNAKFSISYNNHPYTTDTTFTFNPVKSDSLLINIIDSLSPSCPALIEKVAYQVDTLTDKDTGSLIKFTANVCQNSYLYSIKPLYTTYEFYKNNVLVNSGANASFMFTNLVTGDKLTAIGKINSCEKVYGPVSIVVNAKPNPAYTFVRSWKTYTLTATTGGLSEYKWYAGSTLLGSGNPLVADFTAYNNSNVNVKLVAKTAAGCVDSSTQSLTVPNFSSVNSLQSTVFNIYPNPFGDKITVESQLQQYHMQVLNSLGQVVYIADFKGTEHTVVTSEWASGMYYIVIKDADSRLSTFKFVKQ